jgi:hypothetical protein
MPDSSKFLRNSFTWKERYTTIAIAFRQNMRPAWIASEGKWIVEFRIINDDEMRTPVVTQTSRVWKHVNYDSISSHITWE